MNRFRGLTVILFLLCANITTLQQTKAFSSFFYFVFRILLNLCIKCIYFLSKTYVYLPLCFIYYRIIVSGKLELEFISY